MLISRKTILQSIAICITFTSPLHAQIALGLQGGFSLNYFHTDISQLSYTHNRSESGLAIGIPLTCNINHWLSFKTAFMFTQKNYTLERTGPYTGIYTTFNNTYLQLPLMLSAEYGNKKIKAFANAGMYAGYWAYGKQKGRIANVFNVTDEVNDNGQVTETFTLNSFDQKYTFDSRKDRRFEWGAASGLGIAYFLNGRSSVVLEADYFQSLTDQQKHYMINQNKRINQTFICLLGYMYHFNTHK